MDELIDAAKQNNNQLFVMGVDVAEQDHHQWIRELVGSGPVEVLLLKYHPHFENVPGTRSYILKEN